MNPVLLNLFNSKKLRSTTWKICRLGLPLKLAWSKLQPCKRVARQVSTAAFVLPGPPPAASASALITKLTRHAQPGFLLHAAGTPDTGDKIEPEVEGGKKCVVPRKNRFPQIPHAI